MFWRPVRSVLEKRNFLKSHVLVHKGFLVMMVEILKKNIVEYSVNPKSTPHTLTHLFDNDCEGDYCLCLVLRLNILL